MNPCRVCGKEVASDAFSCPGCGAPYPARPDWDGWGFEYKSGVTLAGLPLLHISFKYRPNRAPVPARGVLAIGQFAMGIVTVSQFGIGVVSVGQFAVGGWVLAQIGVGWSLIAQIGFYLHEGRGQVVRDILSLMGG